MTDTVEEIGARRGRRVLVQAAGAGMAMLGSSMPGTAGVDGAAHADHGYSPARWAGVSISAVGWVVGGVGLPLALVWLVVVGGALQVVAVAVALALNAAGHGHPGNERWEQAKAQARARRTA